MTMDKLVVGIDVGGTNTDAVLLNGKKILRFVKVPTTTTDIADSLEKCVRALLEGEDNESSASFSSPSEIIAVFLGTTTLLNALLEGRGLQKVAVVRLCGPSSRPLRPLADFPPSLRDIVSAGTWLASGGLRFDGTVDCSVDEAELARIAKEIISAKADAVVVSGTFSPVDDSQEKHAMKILHKMLPSNIRVSVSSASGQLGLLARENSAVLNACLYKAANTRNARRAFYAAGIPKSAKLFFTSNDGSIISFEAARTAPLRCVACGPTNSMSGAAFLAGEELETSSDASLDKIVLDVGGTSTDAGCLVNGKYPRDANAESFIAGVRCNHRTTDVVSVALGGGSIVTFDDDSCAVGPASVGTEIINKALCFGGDICTATDIAILIKGIKEVLASTREAFACSKKPSNDFPVPPHVKKAWDTIQQKFYQLVENARTDNRPIEVIVVGGGAGLVDQAHLMQLLGNRCRVVRPKYAAVANAFGSALAHAAGEAETIADLSGENRQLVLEALKAKASSLAGPNAEVCECEEVPLAYLPGKTTRVYVRAVAPLDISNQKESFQEKIGEDEEYDESNSYEQPPSLRSQDLHQVSPTKPKVENGIWTLSEYDVHCLAVGSGVLGCGGGGGTHHGLLQLLAALRDDRSIHVVSAKSIPDDAIVVRCGFMGAPTVSLEVIGSAEQVLAAVQANYKLLTSNKPGCPEFITLLEVGGFNGLLPLVVGGIMDRPVVDADLMGRAFPELQMTTTAIYGLPQSPVTASDSFGRCVSLHSSTNAALNIDAGKQVHWDLQWAERVLRPVCVEFGCWAGLAYPPLTGLQIRRFGVLGSISRARRIGDLILRSSHPSEAIRMLLERESGQLLFEGKISDVERETSSGFAKGKLTILAEDGVSILTIDFQNEFLVACRSDSKVKTTGTVVGCVPDIISLIDVDSARPIATEEVRFGLRVGVILLPVSSLLRTPDALRIVGPTAFGFKVPCKSQLYTKNEELQEEETVSTADLP